MENGKLSKIHEFDWFNKLTIILQETQSGTKLEAICSDNGGEFIGKNLKEWLEEKGIKHELSPSRTSQCNGITRIKKKDNGRRVAKNSEYKDAYDESISEQNRIILKIQEQPVQVRNRGRLP
ncbi:POLX protein [Vespula maculifrons]|uniref:POLX protein n=1 Tax=Vespula maculifrons TaxID=7453 RepID=A0ABD2CWP2_VESMC